MNTIAILILVMGFGQSPTVKQATDYLAGLKSCEFSFFIAKDGKALSRAICVGTFEMGAAVKNMVCASRTIDLRSGYFINEDRRENIGSRAMRVGKQCSRPVLEDLYGPMLEEPKFLIRGFNGTSVVVVGDKFGFKETFLERLK